MVSFKMILYNVLQIRHSPNCSVSIGKHTRGIPYIASILPADRVVIGDYCSIARDVIFVVNEGHLPPRGYRDYKVSTFPVAFVKKHGWRSRYDLPEKRNFIKVGNDVWFGIRATVLKGVTIGDGAIIGAGAVVTHDVPPYAVVAGVPSKILRYRYGQEQIKKLLKIAWWNWDEQKIYDNMDYFYGKVDVFIEKFYEEIENRTINHA
jgi:virginiamycin A acetyltransferase